MPMHASRSQAMIPGRINATTHHIVMKSSRPSLLQQTKCWSCQVGVLRMRVCGKLFTNMAYVMREHEERIVRTGGVFLALAQPLLPVAASVG